MLTGKGKVNRINQLVKEIARLDEFIPLMNDFEFVTLGGRGAKRDPFYLQDESSKQYSGRTHTIDVPDDIDALGLIKKATMEVYQQKTKELNRLYGEV